MVSNRTVALASALLCAAWPAAAQATQPLFAWVGPTASSGGPDPSRPSQAVRVDFAKLGAASHGSRFELALPAGNAATLSIDRLTHHQNGDVSWVAQVSDVAGARGSAVGTSGPSGTFAELQIAGRTWGIVPAGTGHDWLFDKTAAEAGQPSSRANDARTPPRDKTEVIK